MELEPTESLFLKDVSKHQMIVIRDDGVYRHLRFKQPDTGNMYFDLITWPWCLCYTGDMGTYVFNRLEDMFQFFRTDREWLKNQEGKSLYINPSYWAEKVQAACGDGVKEYSAELFEETIKELLADHEESEKEDYEGDSKYVPSQELRDAIQDEVLSYAHDGEHAAYTSACKFEFNGERFFYDFWETNLRTYTYRYIWCCYAMAWGIQRYDETKG